MVFRGDAVKYQTGHLAVFTEQGASASQMAAAKFLDTIARMPGKSGESNDAVSAYTQVFMKEAPRLLKLDETQCPRTWISLPRSRRPTEWDKLVDPVIPLECNLDGHPLAGLLWERKWRKSYVQQGWERVKGWECLYLHKKAKLFLSVYVDDFKMVGRTESLGPMWKF